MIVISDLSESYIQEVTITEMVAVLGGKKGSFINIDIDIAIIPILQFNIFSDGSSNSASPVVNF